MSIYASGDPIGAVRDEWSERHGDYPWGVVRTRDGWEGGGVNTYPTNTSGLHAEISLDFIPDHCVPGHDEERGGWGDRVRLSIIAGDTPETAPGHGPATQLILDREAALNLAHHLLHWAQGITTYPKEVEA